MHRLAPHHPTPTASSPDCGHLGGEPRVELALRAVPEQVSVARRAVGEVARIAGFDADQRAGIALVVSEACSNVVVHAYVGAEPGEMIVHAEAADGRLTVTVGDRGRGMCPRSDSPGIGLGLPLMASLCSTLEVHERHGGGTEICMVFESSVVGAGATWACTG